MTTVPGSRRDGSARETILARVREALRTPAPMPHLKSHAAAPQAPGPQGFPQLNVLPEQAARPWLPDGGETPAERLSILVDNLGKLRALVHRVPDLSAAADLVGTLARERDWKQVAWHDHPLVTPLRAGIPCGSYEIRPAAFDKSALEACDAGITACEALVAQTGSILVSSATCGGRALSILPHVHVVVATCDQIVGTLGDALHFCQARADGRMPSMLSFITGPSRTAHGPKELVVILVG
jgi:L-lactate dehydrogenase complex protein LldG